MTQYENFTVTEINFIEPAGNDLGNLGTQTLSIVPDTGYTLDVNDFGLVAPIPPEVDQNSFVFTQNADRVDVAFSFTPGYIMPSNPIEVPLCFLGFANLAGYSIAGNVDISTQNATPTSQLVAYNNSGDFGSTEVVYTETITANSNYYFFTEPIASLAVGDSTAYNITSQKSYGGPNGELTSITFSVEYTYPAENVSNDLITIVADAIPVVVTTQLINAFNFSGASGYSFTVNSSGEVRDLNLIGDPNAIYSVSLFDDLGGETVLATNQVMGSSGTATIPGITIPSYDVGNPPYQLIISGQINPSIANVGADVVIDIAQQEPVFIEVTATSTDSNLSISGIPDTLNLNANIDYVPGSFPTLNFSFAATSSGPEIVELAPVTANSFAPAIPDPASPAYNYVLNNLTSVLNSSNNVFTVSGTIEVYSSGAAPITHTLNLDNILSTVVLPTIVTTSVSNISGSTATSGGESITDGGGTISSKGIEWSEFEDFSIILGTTNDGTGTANFSSQMTGLSAGPTYYVRAYAENQAGKAYGQVEFFVTAVLPTIVTKGITGETGTEADSGGENITDGGGTILSKGIQWSDVADFSTVLGANNEGTGTADFASTITGLTVGDTYYVRAYAQNEVGTGYGQVIGFVSNITVPCSSTAAAGGVGIQDLNINLDSGGGLIALAFTAFGVPDKMEIIHGGPDGTKVATSGYDNGTDGNSGPFDNTYGTEPSNTVPTPTQVAGTDQFIGTNKGAIPTRELQFTNETGFVADLQGFQQIVWWEYTASDWQTEPNVTVRITGSTGTQWQFFRYCCPDNNCTTPSAP
jgi:hypothetical protein